MSLEPMSLELMSLEPMSLEKKLEELKKEIYYEKIKDFYAPSEFKIKHGADNLKFDLEIIEKHSSIVITTELHPLIDVMKSKYDIYKNAQNGYKLSIQYHHFILSEVEASKEYNPPLDLNWEFELTRDGKEVNFWWRGGFLLPSEYYHAFRDSLELNPNKVRYRDDDIFIESDPVFPNNIVICVPK